jgi:glycosyltransferase involved in cell wall biosynthesis
MALGLPIIATAIGANLDTFEDNQNGFLVHVGDYKAWVQRIMLLKDNLKLREQLGLNARKTLEKRFSTEVNKEYYLDILKTLTSD